MSTNTSSSGTATQGLSPSATEVLAATIAGAVERQLTHYVSSMSQQVDAVRQAAAADRDQLRDELQQQLTAVMAQLTATQDAALAQQQSLQAMLEVRLAEFSQHQQVRLNEVENRVLEAGSPSGSSIDENELTALREHIDGQSAGAHARIDELHKATRRFDEQASAMVMERWLSSMTRSRARRCSGRRE